ncbi:hypothetical protein EDD22DRAFT_851952 [Suillus occidentalis]|nr:hypothetical protein EDD22DRAFT_851952 [Suillus occidentalis]
MSLPCSDVATLVNFVDIVQSNLLFNNCRWSPTFSLSLPSSCLLSTAHRSNMTVMHVELTMLMLFILLGIKINARLCASELSVRMRKRGHWKVERLRLEAEAATSVTAEGSSKSPLTHPAPEVLCPSSPTPSTSSLPDQCMDTDFNMYHASHLPPPQSLLHPPSPIKWVQKPARVRAAGFDDPLLEGPGPLEAEGSGSLVPEVTAPIKDIQADPHAPAFSLCHFLI